MRKIDYEEIDYEKKLGGKRLRKPNSMLLFFQIYKPCYGDVHTYTGYF